MARPGINERFVLAYAGFRKAFEQAVTAHISKADLTPTQFSVLEMLLHKGPCSVNDIISKTLSSSGNIAVVVDNLVKLGLVEKTVDPKDKRFRQVKLTDKGMERISSYYPEHLALLDDKLGGLDREEKDCLIKLLIKLRKHIVS